MKLGSNGLNLIKHFESCRLEAYLDQANVPTIGWGHTNGVQLGDTITQAQADLYLQSDLAYHEDNVEHYVFYPVNNNQFDALVSFCYNEGPAKLKSSTLLKYLNQGMPLMACNQLDRWVYANGHIDPGLVKRRAAEKVLFLTPMDEEFKI